MSRRLLAGMVALGCAALLLCSVPVLVDRRPPRRPTARSPLRRRHRPGRLRRDQGLGHPPRNPGQGVRGDAATRRRVRPAGAAPPTRGIPKTSARASATCSAPNSPGFRATSRRARRPTRRSASATRRNHLFRLVQGLKRPLKIGFNKSPTSNKGVWWGIRPENIGPYFDAVEWTRVRGSPWSLPVPSSTPTRTRLRSSVRTGPASRLTARFADAPRVVTGGEKESPVVIPRADPKNPNQLAT